MKTFVSPTFIMLPRKRTKDRKIALNLNVYRNTHHNILNTIKQQYNEIMKPQMEGVILKTPISIEFRYFKPTHRESDKANVLSIVEKFFCDALEHWGCIPRDNDEFIKVHTYLPTRYDKNNGRVEIKVLENQGVVL